MMWKQKSVKTKPCNGAHVLSFAVKRCTERCVVPQPASSWGMGSKQLKGFDQTWAANFSQVVMWWTFVPGAPSALFPSVLWVQWWLCFGELWGLCIAMWKESLCPIAPKAWRWEFHASQVLVCPSVKLQCGFWVFLFVQMFLYKSYAHVWSLLKKILLLN